MLSAVAPRGMFTFRKEERLVGKSLIDKLFKGGQSRSMSAYPIRVVYSMNDRQADGVPVKVMMSVPKRCFKHAVDRNRVKRQLREAYRQNKALIWSAMESHPDQSLSMVFIWLDAHHRTSSEVAQRVVGLMNRISEKL